MTTPLDAPYVYFVRFWTDPNAEPALLAWLDGGHIAEVVAQPGFLWARRFRLEQDAPDGWHAYVMIYGVASKAALEAYFVNPIHEKFKRENAQFQATLRSERMWGAADFAHAKRSAQA
jgi:hypothetical protein